MQVPAHHLVKHTSLQPPFPEHLEIAIFGKGCFWGVEESFWELDGVFTTAVGYAGGDLEHPTYAEVCTGDTGHAEVVLVVYDPAVIRYERLLERFWKGHRPIQSNGSLAPSRDQYRSVIFASTPEQLSAASESRDQYQKRLSSSQRITTVIAPAPVFYYAEPKHQQYFAKQASGRRGLA